MLKHGAFFSDCSSAGGWRKSEADAAHQAANGFARNALRALPPVASRYTPFKSRGRI